MSKSFVINCIGTMNDEMRDVLAYTDEDHAILGDPSSSGGSSIINPRGDVIAGPLGPDEGILYADIDLAEGVLAKGEHDFAGHYNRPDVFQVTLNTHRPLIYTRAETATPTAPAQPLASLPADDSVGTRTGIGALANSPHPVLD